jgi:hypothetical protein
MIPRFLVLFLFTGLSLTCEATFHKVGEYCPGALFYSVSIKDNMAYVMESGGYLRVIDITDPTDPGLHGSLTIPGFSRDVKRKMFLSDTLLFVVGLTDVFIINIADPAHPTLADSITSYSTKAVVVSDTVVCISTQYQIDIYTISDHLSPQYTSRILYHQPEQICMENSYLYFHEGGKLFIFDLKNPVNPVLMSDSLILPQFSNTAFQVSESVAYVANGSHLISIDVQDPSMPFIIDTLGGLFPAENIRICGTRAIVCNTREGVQVLDVSLPGHPELLGFYETPWPASDGAIKENFAFIADYYGGLQIIDISDPVNNNVIGSLPTIGESYEMAVNGNYIYLANGNAGLAVIDISNCSAPELKGRYFHFIGNGNNVSLRNNKMIFGTGYPYPELYFADITDPLNPVLQKKISYTDLSSNSMFAFFQNDDTIFIGGKDTVDIADGSEFSDPEIIGKYGSVNAICDIQVCGNIACFARSWPSSGVEIVNIADLHAPVMISTFNTTGYFPRLAMKPGTLFIADGKNGLLVCDVSNPEIPAVIDTIKPHPTSNVIARPLIIGNILILADQQWNELFVYDITSLSSIQFVSSLRSNTPFTDIKYSPGLLFCSNGYHGLSILDGTKLLSLEQKIDNSKVEVKINPNPVHSFATLTLSGELINVPMILCVYNTSGQQVFERQIPKQHQSIILERNNLPSGIYFYSVSTLSGIKIGQGKFIID